MTESHSDILPSPSLPNEAGAGNLASADAESVLRHPQTVETKAGTDVAVLVVSCDAYKDLWAPFFHCFFKYWPDCPYQVFLGSNHAPFEDSRVNVIQVGPDIDYSSNLMKMLAAIDQEWVILWIDDRFIGKQIDTARLARCIRQVQEQHGVFGKLVGNNPYARTTNPDDVLAEIPRGEPYRVSITVGVWQKRALLQLLREGETAWELEHAGSVRSNDLDGKFFSVAEHFRHDPPVLDEHIIIKGRVARPARPFLDQEGLLQPSQTHRQIQTRRSAMYVRLFVGFRHALLRIGLDDGFKFVWRGARYLKGLRSGHV